MVQRGDPSEGEATMNDPKTLRSLVETANTIDRTFHVSEESKDNATKVAAREDLRKRLTSTFRSCGTDLVVEMKKASIGVSFKAHDGRKVAVSISYLGGRWNVSFSEPVLGSLPIDENNTASRKVRDHAEHFVRLSTALRNVESLLTGFYGIGDITEASASKAPHLYWSLRQSNRGQIVLVYHAQQKGRSEGDGGPADDFILELDRSDMSWSVLDKGGKAIIRGKGKPYPTVRASLAVAKGGRWDRNDPGSVVTSLEPG